MIVLKYGGSSLETIEKIQAVAKKIIARKKTENEIVVVVSAMGKTTNQLLELAHKVSDQPNKREIDALISTGEQVSASLLSMALNAYNTPAISLNGYQAGIQTEGIHTKNKIKDIDKQTIDAYIKQGNIVIVTGFQGINDIGDITTLGRGGSDTTAVALASVFKCPCEIYTDIDGIYGVDPRIYPDAKKLHEISYEEMSEFSSLGAKIMEPRAVGIGQKFGVEILVASTHTDETGTTIKEIKNMIETRVITGLSVIEKIVLVSIHNFPNRPKAVSELFSSLASNEINIDMISQTTLPNGHLSISFTSDSVELKAIESVCKKLNIKYPEFEILTNTSVSKLSVVGLGMRSQSGIAAKIFDIFADHDIPFQLVTTSEISISYTIPNHLVQKGVTLISDAFGL
jgi:aspartate kinase